MAIIADYKAPKKANPYAADVAKLAELGDNAAYEVVAPTEAREGERKTILGEKVKFQAAARDAGFSAVQTEKEEREDGTTRLVFVLKPKRERKNSGEPGEVADSE